MATAVIDARKNGAGTTGFPSPDYMKKTGVLSILLDLSKASSIRGSALTAGDTIQLCTLPYGAFVKGASVEVLTAAGGGTSATLSVGLSGGSTNTIVDTANIYIAQYATVGTGGSLSWHYQTPSGGAVILATLVAMSGTVTSGLVKIDIVLADIAQENAVARDK